METSPQCQSIYPSVHYTLSMVQAMITASSTYLKTRMRRLNSVTMYQTKQDDVVPMPLQELSARMGEFSGVIRMCQRSSKILLFMKHRRYMYVQNMRCNLWVTANDSDIAQSMRAERYCCVIRRRASESLRRRPCN